jgi:hypothetical protein
MMPFSQEMGGDSNADDIDAEGGCERIIIIQSQRLSQSEIKRLFVSTVVVVVLICLEPKIRPKTNGAKVRVEYMEM